MLLFLLRTVARLPLHVLHTLGRAVGRLIYALPGRFRQRLRANAAQAGYDDPAFARRAAGETGALIFETLKVWLYEREMLERVDVRGAEVIEAARAEGRGVLFLTPHLGCYEISARYIAQTIPLTVMFRESRQAWLRPLMQAARNTRALRAVPATTQGVREFMRALKRREGVGMLPDQVPSHGDGVWAPMFGRPAYTVTLPGRLAAQSNAVVIMVASERLPRGRGWQLHFVRAPDPEPESSVQTATRFNAVMETMIRRFPDQYLWSYNRYKAPKGAPSSPASPSKSPPHSGSDASTGTTSSEDRGVP
jgi:KDO2-lipid IV(A) lauroyltransferase